MAEGAGLKPCVLCGVSPFVSTAHCCESLTGGSCCLAAHCFIASSLRCPVFVTTVANITGYGRGCLLLTSPQKKAHGMRDIQQAVCGGQKKEGSKERGGKQAKTPRQP